MARARSPNRNKAFELYKSHGGSIKLKDIAAELNVSEGTVRGWKNKDEWEQQLNGTFQKKVKKNTERSVKKNDKKKERKIEDEIIQLENSDLTEKQKLFCIYYVKYFNGTKAAIKAGYSKDTARFIASENLTKPHIETEINKLKASKFSGAFLEKGDLLQKWIDIAFADITDYVDFGIKEIKIRDKAGNPVTIIDNYVNLIDSGEIDGTIISEVSKGKDGAKIKLQDKVKALEFLSKHMGLLDMATKERLDLEKEKVAMAKEKLKQESQGNDKNIVVNFAIPRPPKSE